MRKDTSAAILGVTGSLALNGDYTVKIDVTDKALAAKYEMKFVATVGATTNEKATFTLYLIRIDINPPTIPDPIFYTVKDPEKKEFIPFFKTPAQPGGIAGWD